MTLPVEESPYSTGSSPLSSEGLESTNLNQRQRGDPEEEVGALVSTSSKVDVGHYRSAPVSPGTARFLPGLEVFGGQTG